MRKLKLKKGKHPGKDQKVKPSKTVAYGSRSVSEFCLTDALG